MSRLLDVVLVASWAVGAFAGGLMLLGGAGATACGLGAELAGCARDVARPLELVIGLGGVIFGALFVVGFGRALLDAAAGRLDRRR